VAPGTGPCLEGGQPAQRLDVPREPAPADHADAGASGHGMPAEFFALLVQEIALPHIEDKARPSWRAPDDESESAGI
jgi:hypothetical protein